jgi:hypothetical protein
VNRLVPQSLVPVVLACAISTSATAVAQETTMQHEHMDMGTGWEFMQDGILFLEFNHQSGPRGGDEAIAPNWWMGMASRQTTHGRLTFTAMLSLDPLTVGANGYRELLQAGEMFHGSPLIDRQHPHDLFGQLAAAWRIPLASSTALTIAGGPVGEPALGPIAFIHRPSAADNPTAPLSHHTFDSTHIAFGVASAIVDHGPWTVEGSVFNGREPDDNRWNFDFGPLDSVSGRVWFRPNSEWAVQVSTGRLRDPEALHPGIVQRTTATASWTRTSGEDVSAVTFGYGRNDWTYERPRNAVFAEATHHWQSNTVYTRVEALEPEYVNYQTIGAFTAGAVRDVLRWREWQGGIGADGTLYAIGSDLHALYGARPFSFHVFFRVRPPVGPMGRMWNMRMGESMH